MKKKQSLCLLSEAQLLPHYLAVLQSKTYSAIEQGAQIIVAQIEIATSQVNVATGL